MEAEEHFYKLPLIKRLIWRLLIACLGLLMSAVFLLLIFYGINFVAEQIGATRVRLRIPVFAFFLPIFGFFVGWKQAEIIQPFLSLLYRYSLYFRIFVFGTIFYTIALTSYIEVFEPNNFRKGLDFGRFDFNAQFGDFLKLLLFPPSLLAVGLILMKKVKPKNNH